jgi:hypothetical protein
MRIFLSYLCLNCLQKLDAHKNCLLPNDFESHQVRLQNSIILYFASCKATFNWERTSRAIEKLLHSTKTS